MLLTGYSYKLFLGDVPFKDQLSSLVSHIKLCSALYGSSMRVFPSSIDRSLTPLRKYSSSVPEPSTMTACGCI